MAEQKRNTRNTKSTKVQPVNDYGRIQPQAPELEEAVLGALMIEKDAYSLVSEILRPESFYERRHQLIYSAISRSCGEPETGGYSDCERNNLVNAETWKRWEVPSILLN